VAVYRLRRWRGRIVLASHQCRKSNLLLNSRLDRAPSSRRSLSTNSQLEVMRLIHLSEPSPLHCMSPPSSSHRIASISIRASCKSQPHQSTSQPVASRISIRACRRISTYHRVYFWLQSIHWLPLSRLHLKTNQGAHETARIHILIGSNLLSHH
jgi:hypothetical protein